jgi:lysophospholipase L1-like esterase
MRSSLHHGWAGLLSITAGIFTLAACGGGSGTNDPPPGTNRAPTAHNACHTILDQQTDVVGNLNADDPDGDELVYSIVSVPESGTATTTPAGVFTYRPTGSGRRGMDKFTFRATDSKGASSEVRTITILNNGKVRIMPLGDSITLGITEGDGCGTGCSTPADGERVSYRRKLFADLNALYPGRIDFVGSLSNGLAASPPIGDPDHNGVAGISDSELAASVVSKLNADPADILLLHIGTNSFSENANDVQTILNNIDSWEANNHPVTVFLARIIDDANGPPYNLNVEAFNNNVQSMVSNRPDDKVIMVNQQTGAGIDYTVGVDMGDDLHPNQSGYDKMANRWRTSLTDPANVGTQFIGMPSCQ